MREFKFFQKPMDEITLPMRSRVVPPISQDLVPVHPMEQPDRLRWVDVSLHNMELRVYTHLHMNEVMRIIRRTILPFIFEPNNQINRFRLIQLLEARFHRAYIITH